MKNYPWGSDNAIKAMKRTIVGYLTDYSLSDDVPDAYKEGMIQAFVFANCVKAKDFYAIVKRIKGDSGRKKQLMRVLDFFDGPHSIGK